MVKKYLMNNQFDIDQFLSLEGYATDKRIARRKGANGPQEKRQQK